MDIADALMDFAFDGKADVILFAYSKTDQALMMGPTGFRVVRFWG
jgi:hypothetical protein